MEVVSRLPNSNRIHFEFQHQRYEYLASTPENEDEIEELIKEGHVFGSNTELGVVRLVRCPVDRPVKDYVMAKVNI